MSARRKQKKVRSNSNRRRVGRGRPKVFKLNPAACVIRKFGGEVAVASILGVAASTPYRWQAPREVGGSGGKIPYEHTVKLIEHARRNHMRLHYRDFYNI